jgi:hypothetical protein
MGAEEVRSTRGKSLAEKVMSHHRLLFLFSFSFAWKKPFLFFCRAPLLPCVSIYLSLQCSEAHAGSL